MENTVCFSADSLKKYPFLKNIVDAAEHDDSEFLLRVLNYSISSIIMTNKYESKCKDYSWEKKLETMAVRVGEELKRDISQLGDIKGVGSSAIIREAIEFYLDYLQSKIKLIPCNIKK